jgi:hypothetical protein
MICCGLDLKFWDQVEPSIQEALFLDAGRISTKDIKDAIQAQEMQLWGIHDGILRAVVVTEMVDYKQMRVVRFITCTGRDMDTWLDLLIDTVSQWGAEQGAHALEFVGRKGWEKTLGKRGFGNTQVFMTKII